MGLKIEIKTLYPCESYYIDLEKATDHEAFILQTFGYYPGILAFGALRIDKIIKCDDDEKLFKYDRFAFFTDEFRKKAFENIVGEKLPMPMDIAKKVERINKYSKKEFNWYFTVHTDKVN